MSKKSWSIIFIEDEILISLALRALLINKFSSTFNYIVSKNFNLAEKIIDENYSKNKNIILVCDYNISGETADNFLININTKYPDIVKILLSAHQNPDILNKKVKILKFIKKPWSEHEIINLIENVVSEDK